MDRLEQLTAWAKSRLAEVPARVEPASEDASFRRYFRLTLTRETLIAMDAPPPHESCAMFVRVAELFRSAGVNVPRIVAQDLERGFLLLGDFGSCTYLDVLDEHSAEALYQDAVETLVRIQVASRPDVLPAYDRAMLARELELFPSWYVERHLRTELDATDSSALARVFDLLLTSALAQPQVFVHRDYHSRNLMVVESNPGVLDFQDAVYGPLTYDLVSLFKDAYAEWPEERVLDWVVRYWEKARRAGLPVCADFGAFYRDFEWMGVQRHLKVLGIFARLAHRDGKDRYLADIPLVLRYVQRTARRYRELFALADLLDRLHGVKTHVGHTF